jgi:hypothetical protein
MAPSDVSEVDAAKPLAASERKQLELFADLIRGEIESMDAAVARAEARTPRRRSRASEERERRLEWLRGRIVEAKDILAAMTDRLAAG